MSLMYCRICQSPFLHRSENPVVWDSLNAIPIGFCSCSSPNLIEPDYTSTEYREAYWLATEPTSRQGQEVSVTVEEAKLYDLGWLADDDAGVLLTPRGRKLFPLMMMIASDLVE